MSAGDYFLSRSRLAQYQDGRVSPGDLPDVFEHFDHRRAPAYYLVVVAELHDLLF
jgi:hypothetical protein